MDAVEPEPSSALLRAVDRALERGAFPTRPATGRRLDKGAIRSLELLLDERLNADCLYLLNRFGGCDFSARITYGEDEKVGIRTVLLGEVPILTPFIGPDLWSVEKRPVSHPQDVQAEIDSLRSWTLDDLGRAWLSKLLPVFGNSSPVAWVCYDFRFDSINPPLVLVMGEVDPDLPIFYLAPDLAQFLDAMPDGELVSSDEWWEETLERLTYEVRPRQRDWNERRTLWLKEHRSG